VKNKNKPAEVKPVVPEVKSSPTEYGYIIRKLSLSEWQVIDIEIQDGKIVKRVEREPNLAAVVSRRLMLEIGRT